MKCCYKGFDKYTKYGHEMKKFDKLDLIKKRYNQFESDTLRRWINKILNTVLISML